MMHGSWGQGAKCRPANKRKNGRMLGTAICYIEPGVSGSERWIVVLWEGDDIPELWPAAELEIRLTGQRGWKRHRSERTAKP